MSTQTNLEIVYSTYLYSIKVVDYQIKSKIYYKIVRLVIFGLHLSIDIIDGYIAIFINNITNFVITIIQSYSILP